MTDRIDRVKDALGIGDHERDDRDTEIDRLRPAPPDGDPQYAQDAQDARTQAVDDPSVGDPVGHEAFEGRTSDVGPDPQPDPRTDQADLQARHVDPSFADPVASGDAWAASDSPAETAVPAATTPAAQTSAQTAAQAAVPDDGQWRDLQARFVDEPETVTREAAVMVDQAVARLTEQLAAAGGDGSTESLRHAFRRYREVYRLLTTA